MTRVTRGTTTHKRHKKVLALAKGYRGRRKNVFRVAKHAVLKAGQYAYRDRRSLKREMRGLWIARINAATRAQGLTYRSFMHALGKQDIQLNRKVLADMAVHNPHGFDQLVASAKETLAA